MSPGKKEKVKKKVAKKVKAKEKESPAEKDNGELKVRPVNMIKRFRSWLFYGRSGTGKTTIAGSFPTPMLLFDVKDQGTDSVCDLEGVDVREVETWDDFEIAYWWLIKNPTKYKTIVIDTITQLQQVALERVLEDADKDPDKAGEWGVMTKREWGQVASMMKMWITNLRDLPLEVVFLAQDRLTETENDDPEFQLDPEMGPRLSPSIAAHINAEVQVVGNTFIRRKTKVKKVSGKRKEVSRTQYCLRLGPNPVYVTKARKPKSIKLPQVVIDPSYDELVAILEGE
jgi:DNA polymerase III delta prime subunit